MVKLVGNLPKIKKLRICLYPIAKVFLNTPPKWYIMYHIGVSNVRGRLPKIGKMTHRCGFFDPITGDFGVNLEVLGWWLNHGAIMSDSVNRLLSEYVGHYNPSNFNTLSFYKKDDVLLKNYSLIFRNFKKVKYVNNNDLINSFNISNWIKNNDSESFYSFLLDLYKK